jgi:acid phosphatase type 7
MKQWVMFVLALGTGACAFNQSGNTGTSKSGDTSRPAERSSPLDPLRAACGSGDMTALGKSTLRREPYLQQVSASGALVGWTSTHLTDERVAMTMPDGSAMPGAAAEPEQTFVSSSKLSQMWSTLNTLTPGTTYCYQVADGDNMLTERTGFRTAPAANSTEPVRFLVFGDSGGGGSDQYALLQQMYTVPFDLILHTGDVAYDDGSLGQYEENVFGVYGDLFRSIPFFPAAGNHDYRTQSAAPFRDVFNLPGASGEKWYSYDWGPVHFVALDTEADYRTQAEWLDEDLSATQLPWKVIYMHRPPYSSGSHGSDTALRKALAPVVKRHGVQLVLAGHDHDYERMLPQDGTAYLVTGGGGIGTRSVGSSSFTAFSADVIHFVYGEVTGDELVLHAIDATGREFDSMVIPRNI